MTTPQIAIVLPCFNEEESIDEAAQILTQIMRKWEGSGVLAKGSFILFVDDGSLDLTWKKIYKLSEQNELIKGLKLSRNYGHQNALLAGLDYVSGRCDAVISMDADLQQDPNAAIDFIGKYKLGADVVIGVRLDRLTDGWIKRKTANLFYSLMQSFGVRLIPNHADYRLLSKRALNALLLYKEPNIFLRAACLDLGFKIDKVYFNVLPRKFGETKYTFKKMLRLALYGITSYSVMPLRFVSIIGFIVFLISFIMSIYVLFQKLILGNGVPGWASIVLPIYFIGGIQILCIGIVGEYVGNILNVVKNRPRWICEDVIE